MDIKYLEHKFGGRITQITGIAHETYKGVADWFYIGDVAWTDGSVSTASRIAPWAVCFDHDSRDAALEYEHISDYLTVYLRENGKWLQQRRAGVWKPQSRNGTFNIPKD